MLHQIRAATHCRGQDFLCSLSSCWSPFWGFYHLLSSIGIFFEISIELVRLMICARVRHLKRHDRPLSQMFKRNPSSRTSLNPRQPIPRTHGISLADIHSFQWARRVARDELHIKDAPLPLYDAQRPPDYVELSQQPEGSRPVAS